MDGSALIERKWPIFHLDFPWFILFHLCRQPFLFFPFIKLLIDRILWQPFSWHISLVFLCFPLEKASSYQINQMSPWKRDKESALPLQWAEVRAWITPPWLSPCICIDGAWPVRTENRRIKCLAIGMISNRIDCYAIPYDSWHQKRIFWSGSKSIQVDFRWCSFLPVLLLHAI